MKISIEPGIIKALIIASAKNDVRYYLNGVLVEVCSEYVTLVSTDGHIMLAVPLPANAIEGDRIVGEYIVPRSLLESVKPCKIGRTVLPLVLEISADVGVKEQPVISLTLKGATQGIDKPVDGHFPDWRRVIPETASGEIAQFDARLVSRFGDIYNALGGPEKYCAPVIWHNGAAPALVSNLGHGGALGVIMPLREKPPEYSGVPAWVRHEAK